MIKYKIVKLAGASPDLVEKALNKRAEDGFYVEFVDNGWFVLSKWELDLTESEKEKSMFHNNEDNDLVEEIGNEDDWVDGI